MYVRNTRRVWVGTGNLGCDCSSLSLAGPLRLSGVCRHGRGRDGEEAPPRLSELAGGGGEPAQSGGNHGSGARLVRQGEQEAVGGRYHLPAGGDGQGHEQVLKMRTCLMLEIRNNSKLVLDFLKATNPHGG